MKAEWTADSEVEETARPTAFVQHSCGHQIASHNTNLRKGHNLSIERLCFSWLLSAFQFLFHVDLLQMWFVAASS